MAKECRICAKAVSDRASFCPNCGARFPAPNGAEHRPTTHDPANCSTGAAYHAEPVLEATEAFGTTATPPSFNWAIWIAFVAAIIILLMILSA